MKISCKTCQTFASDVLSHGTRRVYSNKLNNIDLKQLQVHIDDNCLHFNLCLESFSLRWVHNKSKQKRVKHVITIFPTHSLSSFILTEFSSWTPGMVTGISFQSSQDTHFLKEKSAQRWSQQQKSLCRIIILWLITFPFTAKFELEHNKKKLFSRKTNFSEWFFHYHCWLLKALSCLCKKQIIPFYILLPFLPQGLKVLAIYWR